MTEQIKRDFEKMIKGSTFSEKNVQLKKKYLNKFIEIGFPSKKLENWKFSDLSQIIKKNINELSFYNDYSLPNKIDPSIFVESLEHNKIVFINGKIEKVDFTYEDNDKIEINDDFQFLTEFEDNNSLLSLNNVFTNKCFKITVKKNYSLKKPLVVYHTTNNKIKSKNINLKLVFQLEQNSSLRLIDLFNDKTENNFINTFYNFDLKENAILKNYKIDKIQNRNIRYSYNNIEQENNSVSETFVLSSGSNFSKSEINCNLKGEYSSAFINGIFSLNNEQHHEVRTIINH